MRSRYSRGGRALFAFRSGGTPYPCCQRPIRAGEGAPPGGRALFPFGSGRTPYPCCQRPISAGKVPPPWAKQQVSAGNSSNTPPKISEAIATDVSLGLPIRLVR